MRQKELKFRVWDKEKKEMRPVYGIYFLNEQTIKHELGNIKYGMHVSTGEMDPFLTDYILLQYTGLKDKNGKEIYEGDVLNVEYAPKEIKWDDVRGGWNYDRSLASCYEILGNIYENKKIIKESI